MNEYEDYLEHGFFQNAVNGIRKAWGTATHNAPKYIKKIGNRYFYTQQELNAYLHKGMKQVQKGANWLANKGVPAAKRDVKNFIDTKVTGSAYKKQRDAYNQQANRYSNASQNAYARSNVLNAKKAGLKKKLRDANSNYAIVTANRANYNRSANGYEKNIDPGLRSAIYAYNHGQKIRTVDGYTVSKKDIEKDIKNQTNSARKQQGKAQRAYDANNRAIASSRREGDRNKLASNQARSKANAANAQYENSWLKRGERAVSSAKKNLTSFINSANRAISGDARSVAAKAKHAWDYDVTGNGYRKEAAAAGRRANEASSKAQRARREANGHSMKANWLNGEYVKARRGGNATPQHVARMQYTSRRSGEETAAAKRSNKSARNYQSVADSQMAAARRANAKANNSLLSRGERMASNIGKKITGANALKRYNQETKNVANYVGRIQSKMRNTTNPDKYRMENYLRRKAEINARKAKRDYDNSLAGRVNNLMKKYRR